MAHDRFPEGFLWGAATSAYQIEGAAREDGRGESIWDRFCRLPGKVQGGDTGDVACDHYHRWRQDVENMRDLGLSSYRFSVAWPRIYPLGKGAVNAKGLDFYSHLVDALLEAKIEPAVTLYHWDLPQALQEKGGWINHDTAFYFADYAQTVFKALGDRVGLWITLNEPHAAAFLGHALGTHAPGITDFGKAVQAGHVLLLAHALALQAYRQVIRRRGRIGIALDLHPIYPLTDSGEDQEAARVADGYQNRWMLDPILTGAYPQDMLDHYRRKGVAPRLEAGDLLLMGAHKPDFLGVNYYFPTRVHRVDPHHPILGFEGVRPPDCPTTEMGWEICPGGLFDLLTRLARDYARFPMIITENGVALTEEPAKDGHVHDERRIEYLGGHLRHALRAMGSGVRLEGYFVWSLLDNFEWANGYAKRFGITRVDFRTQARTWKASARWYQEVIASGGASL
jgi:beta-glucosidase